MGAGGAFIRHGTLGIGRPLDTQRVQADMVAKTEYVCIQYGLIRIPDEFVVGNTPRLMTNNAFTMLAGAVGAIPIAMGPEGRWR